MEHQKILNSLNDANDSKFVRRKWNIVNDNSKANYNAGNEITYNIEVLKSNLRDYNDAYILVRGDITVTAAPETQVSFKNCALFTKCITNLIEYSSNYSERTGSLWFYSKDEATDYNADIAKNNKFRSFKSKAKLLGTTVAQPVNAADGILKNAAIAVPLQYLNNFWRSLETPLINCKVESKHKWTKYCVLSAAGNENESVNGNNNNANNITFTIKDTKLCVPVVT